MNLGGGWIVDVDLRKFFDTIDHGHLREFLKRRVRDGVILRLIGKWLHAGVLDEGVLTLSEEGTPQGGVVSPLLANIMLHYVLDEWFERDVRPRLKGQAFLIRYADDFVIGVAREDDARRILEVLPKRMSKYGLTVHPEKTRLVRFEPPEDADSDTTGGKHNPPRSFDFLGFTHYWGRSLRGYWVIKQKTAASRFSRAVRSMDLWCRNNRHISIPEQQQKLNEKLRGHYAYYGVTGNSGALSRFLWEVQRRWRKWLYRRSRTRSMNWARFRRLLQRYPLAGVRTVRSVYRHAANP